MDTKALDKRYSTLLFTASSFHKIPTMSQHRFCSRIRAEKERLIKEGESTKGKKFKDF